MSAVRSTVLSESWLGAADEVWDAWVLAEMATELALYLWRSAPVAERAAAHTDYLVTLEEEERLAALLGRTRRPAPSSSSPPTM